MSSADAYRPGQARPGSDGAPVVGRGIPDATIARLPVYLRALNQLGEQQIDTVSSGALAAATGVNSAQLRKDLSFLGSYGTRGVGYDVQYLQLQIGRAMGSANEWPVIIVGVGNLGTALANYAGFAARGFRVVALVDSAPELVGKIIHDLAIRDLSELESVVTETGAAIGVIATPAEAAQAVVDRLVCLGVTSILNFAGTVLAVPTGVNIRKVDLGLELQILAFHEQRKVRGSTRGPRGEHESGPDLTMGPDLTTGIELTRDGEPTMSRGTGR